MHEAYAARALAHNPALNAIVTMMLEVLEAGAVAVDEAVARGDDPGLLAGVPCGVKDNLCIAGVRTTCSSRMLEGWTAPYTATAVERMLEERLHRVGQDEP